MKRIATMTLGCKVNHTETQAIEGLFQDVGYQVVPFEKDAEIYLVNTCSVTHLGERKSRQIIRRAIRNHPNALMVVTGCYAQSAPGDLAGIEGVDLIVGTQDRQKLVNWVEERQENKQSIHVSDILQAKEFEELPAHEEGRTRAFFKVQEGCNQYCTYCIIPYTRGPLRSRSLESVQREARKLWGKGFQEVILTGIHLGAYGIDLPEKPNLADLLQTILDTSDRGRVRLGSLESVEVSDRLLGIMKNNLRVARQLHLPLQSGVNKILRSMGRPYRTETFEELVAKVRAELPEVAITTDIIVGFPGETEEDFQETLRFVRRMQFANIHVFPYSPRRGTPAATFSEQIPETKKKERVQQLQDLADELATSFRERFLPRELEVLWEEANSSDIVSGWSSEYIRVYGDSKSHRSGHLEVIRATRLEKDGVWGTTL